MSGTLSVLTPTAGDTEALGARLASALPSLPEAPAIVYLQGELGAGKTTLARGFIRARGFAGIVHSPTYPLLECYATTDLVVVHLDLYRTHSPSEVEGLGLRDLALPGHAWLIEWPEHGAGTLPSPDLSLRLHTQPERRIEVTAESRLGRQWLGATSRQA